MQEVIKRGLIPQNRDRCQSVLDSNTGVYFFDSLYSVDDWIDKLYQSKDKENLELLRFDLLNRKWKIQNQVIGDFYLTRKVNPNGITYLRMLDKKDQFVSLSSINGLLYDGSLQAIWEPLSSYKPLSK